MSPITTLSSLKGGGKGKKGGKKRGKGEGGEGGGGGGGGGGVSDLLKSMDICGLMGSIQEVKEKTRGGGGGGGGRKEGGGVGGSGKGSFLAGSKHSAAETMEKDKEVSLTPSPSLAASLSMLATPPSPQTPYWAVMSYCIIHLCNY